MNRTSNDENKLGGSFTFPGTSLTVHRMGYGAMQLAGRVEREPEVLARVGTAKEAWVSLAPCRR